MATWGNAFGAAGKFVVYSIGWWIIGFIIFGIGAAMGFSGGMSPFGPEYGSYGYGHMGGAQSILGFIITLIGSIIIALGSVASFFKVFSEFLRGEIGQQNE